MEQFERRMPTMSRRRRQACAVLFGLVFAAGCSGRPNTIDPAKEYGYIVVGVSAAGEYGFTAGDTLGEIARARVPPQVVTAAERETLRIAYSAECTRHFQARATYLALLKVSCKPGETIDDGEALVGIGADGTPIGRAMLSLQEDAYISLHPGERSVP